MGAPQGSLCTCLYKLRQKSTDPPLCLWGGLKAIHPLITHNTMNKQNKNKLVKEVATSCPVMCPRGSETHLNQVLAVKFRGHGERQDAQGT